MKGRPTKLDRGIRSHISVPESIYSRIYLILYSELEGAVPVGAYSDFVTNLMREWLNTRELDLAPFGLAGTVRGLPDQIAALESLLITLQRKERE